MGSSATKKLRKVDLDKHNYEPLYKLASSLIPQGSKVVELGCGDGAFGEMITSKCKSYIGLDIDEQAIHKMQERGLEFMNVDITKVSWEEKGLTFIALEVFEHLDQDFPLIYKFPIGSRVVFSVPSFDSEDHRRFFPADWEALDYYSNALDIDLWRKIRIPTGGGYFHLMRGYR